jgi:hypothetical protein
VPESVSTARAAQRLASEIDIDLPAEQASYRARAPEIPGVRASA